MRFTPLIYVILIALAIIVVMKFFSFNNYYSPTMEFDVLIELVPRFHVEINFGRPGYGSGFLSYKIGLLKEFFLQCYRLILENIELSLLGLTIFIVIVYPYWFKKN